MVLEAARQFFTRPDWGLRRGAVAKAGFGGLVLGKWPMTLAFIVVATGDRAYVGVFLDDSRVLVFSKCIPNSYGSVVSESADLFSITAKLCSRNE